jgi:hypothetical protein
MNKIYIKNKKGNLIFEYDPTKDSIVYEPRPVFSCREVKIHRPSVYGNPYTHLDGTSALYKVSTRKEAVDNYENHYFPTIISHIKNIENIFEKYNICLVCWCVPRLCHATIIAKHLCLKRLTGKHELLS